MGIVERVWFGNDRAARGARAALLPVAWLYRGIIAARNTLYDRGVFASHAPVLPVLSLGNLSVGGTGKTPVAAWAAQRLRERGATPAIVLRGYGEDEPLVHERLTPGVMVIADADRRSAVFTARGEGADCAVLDDAFQHRRLARTEDWVLVAAEQWNDHARLLPAGPLREPARALSRATVLVVTRKSASRDEARAVAQSLAPRVPSGRWAVMHLAPDALVDARTGERSPVSWLSGRHVVAAAAIGAPAAFFAQLRGLGAELDEAAFRDHHAFSDADVRRLTSRARGRDGVVCTLKDAVKLAPLWRGVDAPLWYVSQHAEVEDGGAVLDESLERILAARLPSLTAGSAGHSSSRHGHRSSTADR